MLSFKAFIATIKVHMGQSFSRATFRFCVIFQPIIYSFIFYMMYKNSKHINYVNYVVLGSGITTMWSTICFSSAGDIERERYMETLENIFCAPIRFMNIILAKVVANTIMGLGGLVISAVFIKVFFNGNFYIADLPMFILSFLLMVVSFICISMMIAPIFTISRSARTLMNCMEAPIFILCGMVAPVSMLPNWIRPLSYILSPTFAVELMRKTSIGNFNMKDIRNMILMLIVLSLIYIVVANFMFKKVDKLTRIKGTLGAQ